MVVVCIKAFLEILGNNCCILSKHTAASTMVFYSLDYSMSNFEQAKARIHRVSQTENCLYIYLTAKHTIDTKILRALRDKADLAKMLVDDYRNGINPFQEGV